MNLRSTYLRFKNLFHKQSLDHELNDELASHLQLHIDDNLREGMSPEEARRQALLKLGGLEQTKEQVRDQQTLPLLESLLQDTRFALRLLKKSPAFTSIAVLTLALGIGANTALFSVIDAVLLRSLPFHDPSRLVAVRSVDLTDSTQGGDISYPAFLDWRLQTRSFEAMSVSSIINLTYTGAGQAESVRTAVVSANLFSLLGVSPALGRAFTLDEDQPTASQTPVILTHEFWQTYFGGDPTVLGRAVTLDNAKYTVVGVMPARFQFPVQKDRVELWITIAHDLQGKLAMAAQRGVSYLQVTARLKPGVQISQAQSDVLLVQERLNQQYADNRPRGVVIRSESDQVAGDIRPVLLILLGAVAFVLLIACANVASLLLSRATVRRTEFTVRVALGASRWTIVRQLLVESVLLALFGGGLGLLLAHWSTGVLVAMAPEDLARTTEITLDFRVLAFTFFIALATGVLFGVAPAIQASRSDLNRVLVASGRSSGTAPGGTRLRSVLVVFQLAIAFVLMIGAGLLLRSFNSLLHVDPGFRPDHVLTFLLEVPSDRHPGAQRPAFVRELLQSSKALPGVKSASAVFGLPLNDDQTAFTTMEIEGHPVPSSQRPRVAFRIIESQYFQTMGIPLLEGRTFTPEDEQGGRPIAIVNQTFVRQLLPGENPLGRRIKPNISFGAVNDAPMREIVGVIADVKSTGIGGTPVAEVYVPQTPIDFIGEMSIVVRTATDPKSLLPTMRSLVSSMDQDLAVREVKTLDEYISGSISAQRFEALLLASFAALAFVLTIIGLYGVISYMVVQRTREMGIRIALGAQQGSIHRMVLRQGTLLTVIGIAIGLVFSFFTVRLIRGLLYDVQPVDPATFFTVPLLLMTVALLAAYIPARRAARVDPIIALRYE